MQIDVRGNMPIGSQEKMVLLNAHVHDTLRIANAVSVSGLVMPISTIEPSRVDITAAQVIVLCSEKLHRSIPLSVHSWMALQMGLATPEKRVYLALAGNVQDRDLATVCLYRMMIVGTSLPTFLLVHETLWDHLIEMLDPACEIGRAHV